MRGNTRGPNVEAGSMRCRPSAVVDEAWVCHFGYSPPMASEVSSYVDHGDYAVTIVWSLVDDDDDSLENEDG